MYSWNLSTINLIRNKSTSRGQRLIFIHDITKYGTLFDFDVIKGRPIDKIKWKGDAPYVNSPYIKTINEAPAPLPLNSKLIWLSNSHTWDYYDNINSKIFMKWITTKVIPLADRNCPVMQMVPVMDNAPYHHVRGIPSLTSFSNKITFNLMKDHGIDYMLLPLVYYLISILPDQ